MARFDHYCVWIKGDVGEKNYKYFLGFIGGHAALTFYGMWFGFTVLFGIVTKEGLWNAKFRSVDTGEIFTAGYGTIFQYLLNRFPIFVFLVILCSVMCLSLTLFFSYHMYLVKLGFTRARSGMVEVSPAMPRAAEMPSLCAGWALMRLHRSRKRFSTPGATATMALG